jgi:hypothetical protein
MRRRRIHGRHTRFRPGVARDGSWSDAASVFLRREHLDALVILQVRKNGQGSAARADEKDGRVRGSRGGRKPRI